MADKTRMKIALLILVATFIGASFDALIVSEANAGGYPWKNHAEPYTFMFGNHIDDHQQTQIKSNGALSGFYYITFTGEEIGGIPVAEHCDGNTPAEACEVGWILRGRFLGGDAAPTFVAQVGNDHPIWLVQSRDDIPQPGAYSHFHWLGDPQSGGDLVYGDPYNGYILELQAVDRFYFRHNGEDVLVMPGIDIATHVNIVGSFP